jgi:competence protein ComEA
MRNGREPVSQPPMTRNSSPKHNSPTGAKKSGALVTVPPASSSEVSTGSGRPVVHFDGPAANLASTPPASEPAWGLSPADRGVLAVLVLLVAGLLCVHWIRLTPLAASWTSPAAPIVSRPVGTGPLYQIDINSATPLEWAQLDGIGLKLAQRIVRHREQSGPFASVEELADVKGIGGKTIERLRPHLRLVTAPQPLSPDAPDAAP